MLNESRAVYVIYITTYTGKLIEIDKTYDKESAIEYKEDGKQIKEVREGMIIWWD